MTLNMQEIEESKRSNGYFFLLYAFGITFIIAFITWKLAPHIRSSPEGHSDTVGFGSEEDVILSSGGSVPPPASIASMHGEALQKSEAHHERFWSSIEDFDADTDTHIDSSNDTNGLIKTTNGHIIKPTYSVTSSSDTTRDDPFSHVNICWSYVDNVVFAWDSGGYCKESLAHLINTSGGYTVGCAWYTFAKLTFQNIFAFIAYGRILGLFLYAVFVTSITVAIMERIEKRLMRKWDRQLLQSVIEGIEEREINMYRLRYKKNSELVLIAGRLLCGWSWSDFIVACATSVIGDSSVGEVTSFHSTSWRHALVKLLLAIIIFVIGAYYEAYRRSRSDRQHSNSARSRSSSDGVSLKAPEKNSALQADFTADFDSENEDVEDHEGYNAPLIN